MKKLAIASALLSAVALTTGTAAHAYQAEVGASLGYIDPDHGSSGSSYGLKGTYYLEPVQVRDSPLAEAAFLDRASNVSVGVNYDDADRSDELVYGVEAEYFVPNSKFYVSGELSRSEVSESGRSDTDTTLFGAEVGYLLAPGLLVAAGLTGYDNKHNDGVDPTIRAKYVTKLPTTGKDINFEGGASFGDLDEYFLGVDYYLDKTLSIGGDYYDNDLANTSEFGIKARKFIDPQLSVEGRIGFGEIGSNDYNKFALAAKYRF